MLSRSTSLVILALSVYDRAVAQTMTTTNFAVYPAMDYAPCTSTSAGVSSLLYCRTSCASLSGCTGYTYVGDTSGGSGTCYYRTCLTPDKLAQMAVTRASIEDSCSNANKAAPSGAASKCSDTLYKGFATYTRYDFGGSDIASYGGITFAQCVGYCAKSSACGAAVSVGSTSSVNCYLKAGTDSRNLRAVTSYIETGLVGNCASLSGQAPASANAVCTNMSSMSPSAVTRRRKRDEQQCARQGFARCPIPGQMGDTECVDLANSNESCGACNVSCSPAAFPHAYHTGCAAGRCIILTCAPGYRLHGEHCAPSSAHAKRAAVMLRSAHPHLEV